MKEHDLPSYATVSDGELDVLKTLWAASHLKVSQVRQALAEVGRSWAYNTVQTLLNRLQNKGFVGSEKVGRAYLFFANLSQEEFLNHRLSDLADRVCEGSQTPLVQALVGKQRFSKQEIREFRQLLDNLEQDLDA